MDIVPGDGLLLAEISIDGSLLANGLDGLVLADGIFLVNRDGLLSVAISTIITTIITNINRPNIARISAVVADQRHHHHQHRSHHHNIIITINVIVPTNITTITNITNSTLVVTAMLAVPTVDGHLFGGGRYDGLLLVVTFLILSHL